MFNIMLYKVWISYEDTLYIKSKQVSAVTITHTSLLLTVLPLPCTISGAIHPSVPVIPDRLENEARPVCSFLHNPKSDIIALTCPLLVGIDSNTLCGLMSR